MRLWNQSVTRPANCWRRCAPTGPAPADTVLRVDGGMTASDLTMQFLADILGAPVDRPALCETTALGAAYLAGYQAGVCPDPQGFAETWRRERRFKPRMDARHARSKWAGWRAAGTHDRALRAATTSAVLRGTQRWACAQP